MVSELEQAASKREAGGKTNRGGDNMGELEAPLKVGLATASKGKKPSAEGEGG